MEKVTRICNTKNDVICVIIGDGFRDDWILDSICSFLKCANKELFDRYKPCDATMLR